MMPSKQCFSSVHQTSHLRNVVTLLQKWQDLISDPHQEVMSATTRPSFCVASEAALAGAWREGQVVVGPATQAWEAT
jgi:hypothetical protein